jgi:phosphoglycerate kinase
VSLTSQYLPSPEFASDPRIAIPADVIAEEGGVSRVSVASAVSAGERISDIGPTTLKDWQEKIRSAKFVLWNGPLGIYEKGFTEPTEAIAKTLAESGVRAVVGGGDTIAALKKTDFDPEKVFVSTGGGAMLEFLAKGTLPALEVLA